jgi:hypothetical protein
MILFLVRHPQRVGLNLWFVQQRKEAVKSIRLP